MRTKTPLQAEKILNAAGRLFGTQRFHEVRMDDIAGEAEVGKGTLYRYFSDKEELYLALLARASEQFLQRLVTEMERAGQPRARLEALVAACIAYFDEHPHLLDLIQRAEVQRPAGSEFPWQHARDQVQKQVLELFDEARTRGDFSVRDPEVMALILLGGLRGVMRFSKPPRAHDLARRIVDNFLDGVNRPQSADDNAKRSCAFAESN